MLRILYGRSHSGKTRRLLNELTAQARAGTSGLWLLVPEQLSHQAERTLCLAGGDEISRRAEVLSFTRLAARVFAQAGGVSARYLDKGGRLLTMALAVEQVRARLRLFAGRTPEGLTRLVTAVDEFKSYEITPERLREAAGQTRGQLAVKLEELALLLESYDAACAHIALDPRQRLTRLREALSRSGLAEGRHVYIDGFSDFTAQERAVVELLMQDAAELTICLTCDDLQDGLDIFSAERETAAALLRCAQRRGVPAECIPMAADEGRPAPLRLVEQALLTRENRTAPAEDAVGLYSAPDRVAECARAAGEMRRLAAGGLRWREMTLACPDEGCARVAAAVLRDHGVPVFHAAADELLDKPVLRLVTGALTAATGGAQTDEMLAVLKTGLTGLEPEQSDALENYARRWRLRGADWEQPWTRHPAGYDGRWDEEAERQLAALNDARLRFAMPLAALRDALTAAQNVAGQVMALYDYLEAVEYRRSLTELAARLAAQNRRQEAQQTGQLYEILCTALEQLHGVLGASQYRPEEFAALLRLTLSQYDVAAIPATLDAVTIGTLTALRRGSPAVLFVIGAEEGRLPSYSQPTGVLTEPERAALRSCGLELAPDAGQRLDQELAAAYQVFSSPSRRLEVSYTAGEGTQPSFLFTRLQALFPDTAVQPAGPDLSTLSHAAAWCLTSGAPAAGDALAAELRRLRALAAWTPGRLSRQSVAALYGRTLRLSASRLDTFAQCRFAYLMQYGLHLQPPGEPDFDAPAFGTFVHAVLERTAQAAAARGGFAALSDDEVTRLATGFIEDYRRENERNLTGRDARFAHLFHRHSREALAVVRELAAELRQSDFAPCAFELRFARDGQMPPVAVQGETVSGELVGAVDRVDHWQNGEVDYVRVVDYKTGKKSFDYADVYHGMGLQMLLYLFALEGQGDRVFGHRVQPAGVLYFPAREVLLSGQAPRDEQTLQSDRQKQLRRSGLLLDSRDVLAAMEHEQPGRYLPLRSQRDGTLTGSLMSPQQLALLREFVRRRCGQLADGIASGEVSPNPARRGSHDACQWCQWAAVCHLDAPNGAPRMLPGVRQAEFWEKIEQEVNGDA